MPDVFRHFSMYFKGRKVATASGNQYDIDTNNEDQIGDEGWMGVSDGAKMTKLSTDCVVPVAGVGVSIVADMLNNKYVDIGLGIVDGKVHKVKMAIMKASFTADATKGTLNGKFEFSGGKPEITG